VSGRRGSDWILKGAWAGVLVGPTSVHALTLHCIDRV
jgi:hypothetical protein